MKLRILIPFLLCATAWAGGTCPSGANYFSASTGSLVTLSTLGVTNCYFISAAGSDISYDGTTETISGNHGPFLHAPGMQNCSNNCASVSIAAGMGFIFRGGDTWHFGASTSPSTGGTLDWGSAGWNGSKGSPIYIGVDQTWYTGSSWARPILNGDNPLSTSSVASCSYQIGSKNILVSLAGISYVIFDNFELTGMCQSSTGAPSGNDIYLKESAATYNIYEHLYIHGWTALSFAGCSGTSGHCFNLNAIYGSNSAGDQHLQIVVDGSDSNPGSSGCMFGGGYNISQSVFRYVAQIVVAGTHIWHDNLLEHWYAPGDGQDHPNLFEEEGEQSGTNAVYNNVFRYVCSDSGSCSNGTVGIWPEPPTTATEYWFNNLVYDLNAGGNYFNIGQNGQNQGQLNIFNNTFEQPASGYAILSCGGSGYAEPFTAANNLYILDGASPYSASCSGTLATELAMTHATATTDGYTVSETYAYSPTSGSSPTVGVGTNENLGFCTALATAAASDSTLSDAATACQSDTRYACTYNSTNHTVSCPTRTPVARPASGAWDVGAYQYSNGAILPTPMAISGMVMGGMVH